MLLISQADGGNGQEHLSHRRDLKKNKTQQIILNPSIFYFMSVHIEVILDKKQKHIIIIYTNFPTGLRTIDLTILVITSVLYKISLTSL